MTSDLVRSVLVRDRCLVNGAWVEAEDGRRFAVRDPASGSEVGSVPDLGVDDVRRAVDAAEQAQRTWATVPAPDRADILRRWFDLITDETEDLAGILTSEQGKPLAEARGEIRYAASYARFYAEEARRITGEILPAPVSDTRIVVLRQPIGVVAAITPWNFPAAMVTRKVAPALAAGCAVVLKPAGQTPLTALALGALAQRAGLPDGLLNVVTGDARTVGGVLCGHPVVRGLSFTGSTEVGRMIAAQCAPTVKKVALELGGNAPFLVFDDADLDAAVAGAVFAKFRNAGQTCICANRFLVQEGVYDEFVERFGAAVAGLRVGHGLDEGVDVGPLIDAAALGKVREHVADALGRGARLVLGGPPGERGLAEPFYPPTVLRDADATMLVAGEETFGPVAAVFRFRDEDEAVALANDTEYGLGAYFYTRDVGRVWRVAEALETGMVGVNTGVLSTELAPFGGIKQSGIGREGSRHGLDEYLELKYVALGGLDR